MIRDRDFEGGDAGPLQVVYEALLRHPHDLQRLKNQAAYCIIREALAWHNDCSEESIQNYFEDKVAKEPVA